MGAGSVVVEGLNAGGGVLEASSIVVEGADAGGGVVVAGGVGLEGVGAGGGVVVAGGIVSQSTHAESDILSDRTTVLQDSVTTLVDRACCT